MGDLKIHELFLGVGRVHALETINVRLRISTGDL
jgi:hypothetical protein